MHHPIFRKVAKTNFDDNGQSWNGFLHGRKFADGSPDMRCKENYEKARLETNADTSFVIKALAQGFKTNFFVHCQDLDG